MTAYDWMLAALAAAAVASAGLAAGLLLREWQRKRQQAREHYEAVQRILGPDAKDHGQDQQRGESR